jgi:hypothetical protein
MVNISRVEKRLQELCRVNFPDSKLPDGLRDRGSQASVRTYTQDEQGKSEHGQKGAQSKIKQTIN